VLAGRIEAAFAQYSALTDEEAIEQLIKVDAVLRDVAAATREAAFRDRSISTNDSYRDEYGAMGLYIGHQSGFVQYSGALLVKAHNLDPNSPFRAHTLFAVIRSSDPAREPHGMPDLNAAFQYAAEFPDGPFISETYEIIATVYDDFYKSLRKFMSEKIYDEDTHMACFKPYMTAQPYDQQLHQAQVLALQFYEKALQLSEDDDRQTAAITKKFDTFRKMLAAAGKHTYEVWYWCSDC